MADMTITPDAKDALECLAYALAIALFIAG